MLTPLRRTTRTTTSIIGAVAIGALLISCQGTSASNRADETKVAEPEKVTLIVHDSFPNDEFAAAASEATGYEVEVITSGDGGELTNKLVLTKGAPLADAFFGVDHIFASRLIEHDVVEPYISDALPGRAQDFAFDDQGSMTPIDLGATCMNIDTGWFEDNDLDFPESYEDLVTEKYRDLSVILDPTSSTTGASFLIGTIARFGEDGYIDYWQSLVDNGARVEQGWSDAYYGQFTGGSPDGTRPIVLSYSSSPGYTVTEDGASSTTAALLDTCSSQIEYAGVLAGAENTAGAQALIDFMISTKFQDTIADSMYVYPIDESAKIPDEWNEFAPLPSNPNDLTPQEIGAGRDGWFKALGEAIGL